MLVKAYGTFIKRDGHIYRTNTYMEFGHSKKIIGACVLCNPGSSLPLNFEQKELLIKGVECTMDAEVVVDDTMEQLITILTNIYGEELEGRFHIFNLFTLRDGDMKSAAKTLNSLYSNEEILRKDLADFTSRASLFPWVLLGWGCKQGSILNELKANWNREIEHHNKITIGIKGKEELDYWHPLPRIFANRMEYVKGIVDQYKKIARGKWISNNPA